MVRSRQATPDLGGNIPRTVPGRTNRPSRATAFDRIEVMSEEISELVGEYPPDLPAKLPPHNLPAFNAQSGHSLLLRAIAGIRGAWQERIGILGIDARTSNTPT